MMQAIILAGGKGTRLKDRLNGRPKPLVNVSGTPLLELQILSLKEFGVSEIIILVNYKKNQIQDFIDSNNSFGMNILLIDDGVPKGTAGALISALDYLKDTFLVIYGDTLFNVDLAKFLLHHEQVENDCVTLLVHPNDHPFDSDLIEIGSDNHIIKFHPYPHNSEKYLANLVNAAMYVMDKSCLLKIANAAPIPSDLAKNIFPLMLERGITLKAYQTPEYIKDVGTPSRLDAATEYLKLNRFTSGYLNIPQRAVFMDRDGTINLPNGHISNHEQFSLFPKIGKNIKALQNSGYRTVLITNQPVVARGEASLLDYQQIDAKLDSLLAEDGAFFDAKYVCMHHPDSGFIGEVSALKFDCDCRKPKPGLINIAIKTINIDASMSWMIGDSTADFGAAYNAGIFSIGVKTGNGGQDGIHPYEPNIMVPDFSSAVEYILSKETPL